VSNDGGAKLISESWYIYFPPSLSGTSLGKNMRIASIIFFLVALPLVAFAKPTTIEEIQIPITPKEYISLYALQYGASEKELLKVAMCESSLNPNAIHYNDGGKGKHSVGIFQYQERTFDGFDDLIGEDLNYYSYQDQAKLTAYIFAKYPKLKSHWTCYRLTK
jgi:hypothetical protein